MLKNRVQHIHCIHEDLLQMHTYGQRKILSSFIELLWMAQTGKRHAAIWIFTQGLMKHRGSHGKTLRHTSAQTQTHNMIPVWGSWLKTWSWSQSFLAKMPRNFSLQNLGHSVFNFWSLFIYFENLILNKPCTHWISSQGTPFGNILAIGWTQTN